MNAFDPDEWDYCPDPIFWPSGRELSKPDELGKITHE